MVSLGTTPWAIDCRNAKSSPKMVSSIVTRRFTRIAGGVYSMSPAAPWNLETSVPGTWLMPPIW